MEDLLDTKVIFAVGQLPFEAGDEVRNQFGRLVPLALEDGSPADLRDFPNNGLVWWMIVGHSRRLAVPGTLLKGILEPAHRYEADDPTSSYFQVNRESVAALDIADAVELLEVSSDAIQDVRHLANHPIKLPLDHFPTANVFISWRGNVYGLLKARNIGSDPLDSRIHFQPHATDQTVFKLPLETFERIAGRDLIRSTLEVSRNSQARNFADAKGFCTYALVLGSAVKRLREAGSDRFVLLSDADVLRRISKRLQSRKEHKEFVDLLQKLEQRAGDVGAELTSDERALITNIREASLQQLDDLGAFAESVVASGVLQQQLDQAIASAKDDYVNRNAATLQAEVQAQVRGLEQRREELTTESQHLDSDIQQTRARQLEALEEELTARRTTAEQDLAAQRASLGQLQRTLDEQRATLVDRLESVAQRLATAGDEALSDFMVLAPFLRAAGWLPVASPTAGPQDMADNKPRGSRHSVPAFVTNPATEPPPAEAQFFERFKRHVANSGFVYRDVDLTTFHLSVKCGELTILGGVSGLGKSSLPRLYADSLIGSAIDERARFLDIAVSPSWLDVRDLLGYLNSLDRSFQPSESGLYQHLIAAQEEHRRSGGNSKLYVVCLDEMNLAHVEHYFSAFLQALERPEAVRRLRVFSDEAVSADSAFAPWGSLDLPRSVRFVGTVNFDETTKPLSLRLLDRANLIRLRPASLAQMPALIAADSQVPVDGPPVTASAYRSWQRTATLDTGIANVIDALRPLLSDAGSPLTPRRYRAIAEFVASAPRELCSSLQALDLQIAQRVLPQLRGALRPEVQQAAETMRDVLARFGEFPESNRALEELTTTSALGGTVSFS